MDYLEIRIDTLSVLYNEAGVTLNALTDKSEDSIYLTWDAFEQVLSASQTFMLAQLSKAQRPQGQMKEEDEGC